MIFDDLLYKHFDKTNINPYLTEIGLSALICDHLITGTKIDKLFDTIIESIDTESTSLTVISLMIDKLSTLMEIKFHIYLNACINDGTIKDYDSFMVLYKADSPSVRKIKSEMLNSTKNPQI